VDRFAAAHDEAAFGALVRRHGLMVWRVCLDAVRHLQDAEDAFQATFLVLARRAGTIRQRASLASWLHRVAYHAALETRSDTHRQSPPEIGDVAMSQADPGAEAARREQQGIVHAELNQLAEKYRAPLVLCYLEGKTQDEAAQELGWSQRTFRRRIGQARGLLQARLVRRGFASAAVFGGGSLASQAPGAVVPAALLPATVRAACAFVTHSATAGTASAKAAAVAEGVLRTIALAKLKGWVLLAAVCGALVAGTGVVAHQAWVQRNPEAEPTGRPMVVRAALPSEPSPRKRDRLDAFGDPLPAGALIRLGTARLRVGNIAWQVAFAPDGQTLAAGGDGCVRVWEAATGRTLLSLEAPGGRVLPVAFAPAGNLLAAGGLGSAIRLWDLGAGVLVREFRGGQKVFGLVFSPDGRTLVAGGMDGTVRLWNVATGEECGRLARPADEDAHSFSWPVAVFPDNRTIATESMDYRIRLWDASTGQEQLRRLDRLPRRLCAAALAPDGPHGAVVATAEENPPALRLWQVASGQELRRLHGQRVPVDALAFSPDGTVLAAADGDGMIRLWDVATGAERTQVRTDQRAFAGLAFTPDGRVLASYQDTTIRLWEAATGAELHPFAGHRSGVLAVAFDNQSLVSVGMRGFVRRWDPGTGRPLGSWGAPQREPATAAAFSPDGRWQASGHLDGFIRVSNPATGEELRRWQGHKGYVHSLAFAPDGRTLASGSVDKTLALWEPLSGREVGRFADHPDQVRSVAFAPDGRILACGCQDGTLLLREAATGQTLHRLQIASHRIRALAFSPDGKTLASAATLQGAPRPIRAPASFEAGTPSTSGAAVSPEAPGGRVDLWEVATGRARWHAAVLHGGAYALAFAPDGRVLAWGGDDHQVRRWDLATGRELPRLTGHLGEVRCLAFSPDGTRLASGSMDATALVWPQTPLRPPTAPGGGTLRPPDLEARWHDLAGADGEKAYRAVWDLAGAPAQAVALLETRLWPAEGKASPPLRRLRALEILERIATPAACRLLQALATGVEESPVPHEARAALGRLDRQRAAGH
jgi:RNA polymerase sigma factor (sigma-70 family)